MINSSFSSQKKKKKKAIGSGDIADAIKLKVGGKLIYTITGTTQPNLGTLTIVAKASFLNFVSNVKC